MLAQGGPGQRTAETTRIAIRDSRAQYAKAEADGARVAHRSINTYATRWVGFFGVCTSLVESILKNLDAHIRRRLRAIQLKQWKRKRTIARKLIQYGIRPKSAWRSVYAGHKAIWTMSYMPTVDRALPNSYWDERGLVPLLERYWKHPARIVVPVQLSLALG